MVKVALWFRHKVQGISEDSLSHFTPKHKKAEQYFWSSFDKGKDNMRDQIPELRYQATDDTTATGTAIRIKDAHYSLQNCHINSIKMTNRLVEMEYK